MNLTGAASRTHIDGRATARRCLRLLAPAFVIFIVSWPWVALVPGTDIDPSWHAGLAMAAQRGMQFGTQIVFTYGPLGYAKHLDLYFADTYRVSLAIQLLVQFVFCVALFWMARRAFGTLLGFALALLVACFLTEDPMIPLVGMAAIAILADRGVTPGRWFAPLAGVVVGIEAVGKLSVGIVAFVVLLVAVLSCDSPRRRPLLAFFGSAAATFVLVWVVTGQELGNIVDYGRYGAQIVSGYTTAMGLETPGTLWQFWGALLLAAVVFYGGWSSTQTVSGRRRRGLLIILAFLLFTGFKEGFVRHDPLHTGMFFSTMLVLLVCLPWRRWHRSEPLLTVVLGAVLLFGAVGGDPIDRVHPITRPQVLWNQVTLAADGVRLQQTVDANRAALQAAYNLEPATLSQLLGHRVHVEPWEASLAYAYQLDWHPLPVFQTYSAYTTGLDNLNAAATSSAVDGPDRILRAAPFDVDQRASPLDAPRQYLAMLCSFRALSTTPRWQVVGRVAPRCGRSRPLGTFKVTWGQTLLVPTAGPHEVTIADVDGVDVHGLERLRSLVWRPEPRYVVVDGGGRLRLTPGTSGDGLIVRAPLSADFPAPYRVALGTSTLMFERGENPNQPDGTIVVRFRAVAMAGADTVWP